MGLQGYGSGQTRQKLTLQVQQPPWLLNWNLKSGPNVLPRQCDPCQATECPNRHVTVQVCSIWQYRWGVLLSLTLLGCG